MKFSESKYYPFNHFVIGILFFIAQSCSTEAIDEETTTSNLDTDDTAISLEGDLQISDFVWKGLNEFYYWQEEVTDLADSKVEDAKAYAQFISENSDPEAFFDFLNHPDDRFSWIQDDYLELENSLQGIFASNGVEFSLLYACSNCVEVIGVVKYILEGSDAENKNIKRGDVFIGVNGTTLTANNYRSLLFGDALTYSLNMAEIQNGTLTGNGVVVELTKEENFETNPVQLYKTIDVDAGKVGYLMYNQFVASKSSNLNQIFAEFKSQNVTDLILDLRYNGGGSVRNCVELASMITGQFSNQIFTKEEWNAKLNTYFKENFGSESQIDRFVSVLSDGEAINTMNLNRLFVLTTSESASASELLINGLAPFIEVIQIGEQTVGKNVGSITVYDYVNNQERTKNPDHTYAMQPIVLKIANSEGFADYTNGLEPTVEIEEDIRNLGVLGDVEETYLSAALNIISGSAKQSYGQATWNRSLLIQDPLLLKRQKMIVDKDLSSILSKVNVK